MSIFKTLYRKSPVFSHKLKSWKWFNVSVIEVHSVWLYRDGHVLWKCRVLPRHCRMASAGKPLSEKAPLLKNSGSWRTISAWEQIHFILYRHKQISHKTHLQIEKWTHSCDQLFPALFYGTWPSLKCSAKTLFLFSFLTWIGLVKGETRIANSEKSKKKRPRQDLNLQPPDP